MVPYDFRKDYGLKMQDTVKHFVDHHQLTCGVQNRYVDLVSEIGELGKELLKATNYGKESIAAWSSAFDEMGDCLFSIFALCNEMGLDAKLTLDHAIQKYSRRFAEKGTVDSGR